MKMSKPYVFVLIALLVLSACASKPAVPTTGAITAKIPLAPAVQWNGQVKEFTVRAFQYGFDPDKLEVNLGDKVIIHGYTSDVPHGLTLWDYGVNMKLMDKNPVTTEFIADKTGEFTFLCSIPCGSGHSKMQGKLIVKG